MQHYIGCSTRYLRPDNRCDCGLDGFLSTVFEPIATEVVADEELPKEDKQKADDGIIVRYTNWKGQTKVRRVKPTSMPYFSTTPWHPKAQWLIDIVDLETSKEKTFALSECDFVNTK